MPDSGVNGYEYTGQQQNAYNFGMGYGEQFGPTYTKDRGLWKKYNKGDDSKGQLTRFLNPLRINAGVRRENAVGDYNRQMAPGFNQGGGQLMAAADARLRREYDKDLGDTEASAYVQHGEGLRGNIVDDYENAKRRQMEAYGIASGIANSPEKKAPGFWSQFALSALSGASNVAAAYAGKP